MPARIVVADPLATALQAHRLMFLNRVGLRICFLVSAIWMLAFILYAIATTDLWAHIALALAVFATILPPIAYFSGRRLLKKAFQSIPGGAYTYAIDEQGVSWHSPIGDTQVNWRGFTHVHQLGPLWVLIIAERQIVVLPADQLNESSRTLILANVKLTKRKGA